MRWLYPIFELSTVFGIINQSKPHATKQDLSEDVCTYNRRGKSKMRTIQWLSFDNSLYTSLCNTCSHPFIHALSTVTGSRVFIQTKTWLPKTIFCLTKYSNPKNLHKTGMSRTSIKNVLIRMFVNKLEYNFQN